MTITVVIPFCAQDAAKASELIAWIATLGGAKANPCVLIAAGNVSTKTKQQMVEIATPVFASVEIAGPPGSLADERHPIGPNYLFQSTCILFSRSAKSTPFLWLEPDSVPMWSGWLQSIEKEYEAALSMGKEILACVNDVNDPRFPKRIPSGVAVYPPDAWKHYRQLISNKSVAWDVRFANAVMPKVHASHQIYSRMNRENPPTFRLSKSERDPANAIALSAVRKFALVHPCKDDSLIKLLKESADPAARKKTHQKRHMHETSKAMRRRHCETAEGTFNWDEIFTGPGVDVGAGGDPIQLPNCKPFDMIDGDANHLSRYFKKNSMGYIHASQCLEHMIDPRSALLDWAVLVKPGGHLVVTIPDFDLYEKLNWPSKFNPDHKSAWSTWRKAHPGVPLIHTPTFIKDMEKHGLKCIRHELVTTNYNWNLGPEIDQTWPEDGPEVFIELVFRKEKP